jgi:ATP-dependent HslUV protease ATP-binding subunit HslU
MKDALTPIKIVEELNKYIIGQDNAKRAVAIALRNRWRRMNAEESLRQEIMPNNILMIGSTGVGKTEIARRLASLADAPFIKVEASKFTEVGYVGRDVESMIRDLVEQSVNMVKEQNKAAVREKAKEQAEEQILDVLIPPVHSKTQQPDSEAEGYLHGSQPQQAASEDADFDPNQASDQELNQRTREKFRQKLKNGELDERMIEIEVTVSSSGVQVMTPQGMEGMDGLQDMLQNMMPKKQKKRKLSVAEAREHFIEEETEKLVDMESVTRDALDKAANSGIIFLDELDKVVAKRDSSAGGADVSREGVQRDMLPIVEGTTVSTKYGNISTDHILFIAAGAFHVAKPSDLVPELQGRLPIRVELQPLTKEDFVNILKQPKNALTKQYEALLGSERVALHFEEEAIQKIAEVAFQVNMDVENIGARRLHTILSTLLEDILFQVPDMNNQDEFTITAAMVEDKLSDIAQQKDLSQYIL